MSFNKNMIFSAAAFCSLLIGQISLAQEIEVTPEMLRDHAYISWLGQGYYEQVGDFAVTTCVQGKVTQSLVSTPSKPFANPVVKKSANGEVKVTVSAVTSTKLVQTLTPPFKLVTYTNPNKKAVCGERFVTEIQIGARISISRSFHVNQESESALIAILNARVTDLQSMLNLDLSKDKLQLSGGGLGLSGQGASKDLSSKMNSCFWSGKDCAGFVKQAYADAKSLDERFPSGRVANLVLSAPVGTEADFGDAVLYKMQSY